MPKKDTFNRAKYIKTACNNSCTHIYVCMCIYWFCVCSYFTRRAFNCWHHHLSISDFWAKILINIWYCIINKCFTKALINFWHGYVEQKPDKEISETPTLRCMSSVEMLHLKYRENTHMMHRSFENKNRKNVK